MKRLTNNSANNRGGEWSPDGTKIAFHSDIDGDQEIYIMNADGSGVEKFTFNSACDTSAAWSPDGTRIVFSSDRDGNSEIYIMNADGSNQKNLSKNAASDWQPAWCCLVSPDPCAEISCPDSECHGYDLWSVKCIDGECVNNHILEKNSEECGYIKPISSPSTSQSPPISTEDSSFLIYGGILIAIMVGFLTIYLTRHHKKPEEKIKKEELRRKLDEDYVEDRISREQYLRKKKDLEGE